MNLPVMDVHRIPIAQKARSKTYHPRQGVTEGALDAQWEDTKIPTRL
jgi:hypothetical protein